MADSGRRRTVSTLGALALGWAGHAESARTTVTSRVFPVGNFETVRLALVADYELVPGSGPSVQVTAEQRVLDRIRVDVSAGMLSMSASGSFDTQQPLKVRIAVPRLRRLQVSAAADLRLSGLRGDRLEVGVDAPADLVLEGLNLSSLGIDIEGSATVTTSGTSQQQRCSVRGSGTYDGATLKSGVARVEVNGAGDVIVNASERLDATISGAGTVKYHGAPRISQRIDGAGTLEKI